MPERWDLVRAKTSALQHRFEATSILAGKLLTTLDPHSVPAEVRAVEDPLERWYLALWTMGGPHRTPMVGSVGRTTDAGVHEELGHIFVGSINDPAAASAALALLCKANTFVPDTSPPPAPDRIESWLQKHARKRPLFWVVLSAVLGLILGVLAIIFAG
jgi:hypothetical protein